MSKEKKFQKKEKIDRKNTLPKPAETQELFTEDMTLDQILVVIKSADPRVVINNERAMKWIDKYWAPEYIECWINNLPEGVQSTCTECVRIIFKYMSRERLEKVLTHENRPGKADIFNLFGDILPDHSLTLFMDTNPEALLLLYYDRLSEEDRQACFATIKKDMLDPMYRVYIGNEINSMKKNYEFMKEYRCKLS